MDYRRLIMGIGKAAAADQNGNGVRLTAVTDIYWFEPWK
jgi:hypothetical protein